MAGTATSFAGGMSMKFLRDKTETVNILASTQKSKRLLMSILLSRYKQQVSQIRLTRWLALNLLGYF